MLLKNKNIIFKIRRSKVTDNAALSDAKLSSNQINDPSIPKIGHRTRYFSELGYEYNT